MLAVELDAESSALAFDATVVLLQLFVVVVGPELELAGVGVVAGDGDAALGVSGLLL